MPRPRFLARIAGRLRRAAAEAGEADEAGPTLPDSAALLDAIDQPMLVVRERRVLIANRAALDLLGDHITGSDVRLALRHPAAAERLTRRTEEVEGPIALTGLGAADRQWEMATRSVGTDLIVRLTDLSQTQATERMREDFVANASHELRTPLATLLGFLETLQDEAAAADAATRTRFLGIMAAEARRMQQLVDDLMSLSRIQAERFRPPQETVDLLPLVREAEAALFQLLREKETTLAIEADAADGTMVAGDRGELLQLLTNLIDNAAKYGRAGEAVVVRIEEGGAGMVRLSVIDRGEGVAAEHIPHLTRRFYRVDAGRSRTAGGTGLGLAIVKHIVERHRGRLEIASEVGAGTIVDVYLPRPTDALSSKSHAAVTADSPTMPSRRTANDPGKPGGRQ